MVSRPADTRIIATELLSYVLDQRLTLDEALDRSERFRALEGSDRGFARLMVSTALRYLGVIDARINEYLGERRINDLEMAVGHLLRIGLAQLAAIGTPHHAAVSETVNAARGMHGTRRAGGLINAVMRRLSEDKRPLIADGRELDTWPKWLSDHLVESLGVEMASAYARLSLEVPPLDLTIKESVSEWSEKLASEQIGPSSIRLTGGNVEDLPGYDDGSWWVQDVAASLPVALLKPKSGERIADLGAAPGGKTLQIASSGAETVAVDRSRSRLKRVRDNLARTKLSAEIVEAKIEDWKPADLFDAVLLDAPCSALGTLRRHPESPWIKTEQDVLRFKDVQARLLKASASLVKTGGRLIYCVCSPLNFEGPDIVASFLEENVDWKRAAPSKDEPFEALLTADGDYQTLPPFLEASGGADAFYFTLLEKT